MQKNENRSIFEKLVQVNPKAEIWWDSSPLIYEAWADELLNSIEDKGKRIKVKEKLLRLYDRDHPEESLFRGVTKIAAGSPTLCGWGGKRRPASVSKLDKSIPLVI